MFEFYPVVPSGVVSEALVRLLSENYEVLQPLVENLAEVLGTQISSVGLDYLVVTDGVAFAITMATTTQINRKIDDVSLKEIYKDISNCVTSWTRDLGVILDKDPLCQDKLGISFNPESLALNIFASWVVGGSMLEEMLSLFG